MEDEETQEEQPEEEQEEAGKHDQMPEPVLLDRDYRPGTPESNA